MKIILLKVYSLLAVFMLTLMLPMKVSSQAPANKTPLRQKLLQLQKSENIDILFDDKIVEGKSTIDDAVDEKESVDKKLQSILAPLGLKAEIVGTNKYVVRTVANVQTKLSSDQSTSKNKDYTISGYVQDEESAEKLIGVSVYHPASGKGTVTNNYGFYSLTIPMAAETEIVFDYIEYVTFTEKVKLTQDISLNVNLSPSITLQNVEIVAEKQKRIERETQMSVAEVPIAQIRKVPALMGEVDVLKVLQLLPGVKSGGEGQSGIYVRGGGPDQNLILLDGVPVYNANHLFGFFSVFNSDAIKDVKLIKGGYPARYGGRLSSVLDINMKEGNMNEVKGSASIGLISSKLMLEGPINKGKTSFVVSGRRTYIDVLARPIIKIALKNEGSNGVAGYYFYDLNAKINHKFSDKDRLYLSSYGGKDKFYFDIKDDDVKDVDYSKNNLGWGNFTNALRWNHVINKKMFLNTTAIYSDYRLLTDLEFGEEKIGANNDKEFFKLNYISGIEDVGLKLDFDYVPTPDHFIRFGANTVRHNFKPGRFLLNNENTKDKYIFRDTVGQPNIPGLESTLFVEDDWSISKNFKVNAGLHFSLFNVKKKDYLSLQPRVSARYMVGKDLSLKASYATMRQYINLLAFEGLGLPTDIWVPSTDRVKPQDSWQAAIGIAKSIGEDYELSIEGYYKKMKNLVAYKDGAGVFQSDDWQDRIVQGNGDAYGAEFFLQKKYGRLSGWVGYTLSWTYRQFPDIDNNKKFPYRFDRRHDISLVGTYKISDRINIAGTWVYGTGNAVTLPNSRYNSSSPISQVGFYNYYNEAQVIGSRNNHRMSAYHRLDVGINFVKKKTNRTRTWSFGAYNTYSNNNPFYLYTSDVSTTDGATGVTSHRKVLKQAALFPIIPYATWSLDF
jgi:outer membrane receptor for ferrienterochelin and colicin